MALLTNQEMAEKYELCEIALVEGRLSSYSIAGRTFTKNDLALIQQLKQYYANRAQQDTYGNVTLSDVRTGSGCQ